MDIHDVRKFTYTKIGMFADDTSIAATSRYTTAAITKAEAHFNALYDYFFQRKIKVNASKTSLILCTKRRNKQSDLCLLRWLSDCTGKFVEVVRGHAGQGSDIYHTCE